MKTHQIVEKVVLCAALLIGTSGCQQPRPSAAASQPAGVLAAAEPQLIQIEDGTVPPMVKANHAELAVVPKPGSMVGAKAIEVSLRDGPGLSGVAFQPAQPWDWSKKGNFSVAFNIANTGDYSVDLFSSVSDQSGESQTRNVSIPADGKFATYYIVLHDDRLTNVESGMRGNPPAWNTSARRFNWLWGSKTIDLAHVAKVSLYTDTILHNKKLLIGGMWLFQNPKIDPNYLTAICDKFGQNNKVNFPGKIRSLAELRKQARDEEAALAKSGPMPDRSKFGGWKDGPRLKATGYFRTEKVGGKWALVDPEGYLYFATGVDNIRMANTTTMTGIDFTNPPLRKVNPEDVTPEDSKGFVALRPAETRTAFVASKLRRNLFTWLPAYNDPLAQSYSYEFSTLMGKLPHGESFSFYQANLQRRYGLNYLKTWRDVTVARMLDWGFTSLGNWTDPMFYHLDKIPYFANGWIIGKFKTVSSGSDYWAPLPDPFDPEFVRRAKVTVKAIADQVRGSPWCVGVFVDNEKSWGRMGSFDGQYGVVISVLALDATNSPAKAAFTVILKKKYKTIKALNAAWGTSIGSWEAFAGKVVVTNRNAAVRADFSSLLFAFASQYFRTVHDALHEFMPHHLYLGCRLADWGMTPEVVKACADCADVVSFNYYKEGLMDQHWDPILKNVDKPCIIGEFAMGAGDTGYFEPMIVAAANQADRARMFKDYMESVIDNPHFVGAHWFQYVDSPLTGRAYDGENYNNGFVATTDVPYPAMVKAAKEVNHELYQRRFGGVQAKQ